MSLPTTLGTDRWPKNKGSPAVFLKIMCVCVSPQRPETNVRTPRTADKGSWNLFYVGLGKYLGSLGSEVILPTGPTLQPPAVLTNTTLTIQPVCLSLTCPQVRTVAEQLHRATGLQASLRCQTPHTVQRWTPTHSPDLQSVAAGSLLEVLNMHRSWAYPGLDVA